MKINGKIIEDQPFWTDRRVKIWQTGLVILFFIGYPILGYKAYQQFTGEFIEQSLKPPQRILTMQSAVIIDMGKGVIINATIGEVIDYAIKEHWNNTMVEELNRIPD